MTELLKELEAQSKWLRKAAAEIAAEGHDGWGNTCLQAADVIDTHHAEIAGAVKDAGRYRWLRERAGFHYEMGRMLWYLQRSGRGFMGLDESVDAAIDAHNSTPEQAE